MMLVDQPWRSMASEAPRAPACPSADSCRWCPGMPGGGSPCWSSCHIDDPVGGRARPGDLGVLLELARSSVGGSSIRSTSPDSSAATRAVLLAERPQDDLLPGRLAAPISVVAFEHDAAPRCHDTNLNGPVPTRPLPALSSAEVLPSGAAPAAALCDRMGSAATLSGISGAGPSVWMRTVSGSTISKLFIWRV